MNMLLWHLLIVWSYETESLSQKWKRCTLMQKMVKGTWRFQVQKCSFGCSGQGNELQQSECVALTPLLHWDFIECWPHNSSHSHSEFQQSGLSVRQHGAFPCTLWNRHCVGLHTQVRQTFMKFITSLILLLFIPECYHFLFNIKLRSHHLYDDHASMY